MEPSCIKHVGNEDITVLVHFVGISWLVAARGGKGELGNSVEPIIYLRLVDLDMRFWLLNLLF